MNKNVEDIINITENKSNFKNIQEIVGVCKRINNSKRDFLFVNKYQGKHYPQSPGKILELYDKFIENIKVKNEKILVIGFAETATAIANYVSAKLADCIFEMQTTRENIDKIEPIIEFKEEHSHATQQLLYGNKEILNSVEKVLFIEDEITTGKTIVNFINEINKINPNLKYAVASILNWQNKEATQLFKENNIETFYLIKGEIKNINATIDVEIKKEEAYKNNMTENIKNCNIQSELCNLETNRIGRVPIKDINFYENYMFEKIKNKSNILKNVCQETNKKILIIGTEEFMYEPLLFADYLEKNTQNRVFYHATTRSPIEVSNEEEYLLRRRYKFNSCYDENRITYLYNLEKYDNVFIITDSNINNKFIQCMSNIFSELGNDLEKIEIINLKGINNELFSKNKL